MSSARACLTWVNTLFCIFLQEGCGPSFKKIQLPATNKLKASDGSPSDHFGLAVSISGERAIVGAHGDDDNGTESGSAYIFKRASSGWDLEMKLGAIDGKESDWFAHAVSMSGDWAIVGARGTINRKRQSGFAYVYYRSKKGWVLDEKLVSREGGSYAYFGCSVDIEGERAIVGAKEAEFNGVHSGLAFVFRRDEYGWQVEAVLSPNERAEQDFFGHSVSISGDRAIVGSHGDDDNRQQSGSANIFRYTGGGWELEQKLLAKDGTAHDVFGQSVAISGGTAIVGAHGDSENGKRSGSAYVFERTKLGWIQRSKLLPQDGRSDHFFGISVSISGGRAIVGARGNGHKGTKTGSAYLFRRTERKWTLEAKLVAADAARMDYFGQAVSISDGHFIVGAHGDDDNGSWSGSAYVY